MNIFYYSVHHVLEDDEVRLLKHIGHNVFCIGSNRRDGAIHAYRPAISFNATEHVMFDAYDASGGTYNFLDGDDGRVFPPGFEGHFSAFIVMHDISFIARFWHRMRGKPVFWRTIGQGFFYEDYARPLREEGLKIIRYSEVEKDYQGYCGGDAVIRFCKNPSQYDRWVGDVPSILLFSNSFAQRFPGEAEAFRSIAACVPCTLGGGDNEDLPASIGFIGFEHQLHLYRSHRAYLYISGLQIPYTLNFIEAWMTGIPVVVFAPLDRRGEHFEIDRLMKDGETGYICRDIETTIDRCNRLLADRALAESIGRAGRDAAIRHFGFDGIARQWSELLSSSVA